jgi:hypothetical protein
MAAPFQGQSHQEKQTQRIFENLTGVHREIPLKKHTAVGDAHGNDDLSDHLSMWSCAMLLILITSAGSLPSEAMFKRGPNAAMRFLKNPAQGSVPRSLPFCYWINP